MSEYRNNFAMGIVQQNKWENSDWIHVTEWAPRDGLCLVIIPIIICFLDSSYLDVT
jgi:hypothetical protein